MREVSLDWSAPEPLFALQAEFDSLQREVARRREAEAALHALEQLHRITLESVSDAVFLTNDAGEFEFICPNVAVVFGYTPQETRALCRIDKLLGPDLFDFAELESAGELRSLERVIRNKSGLPRELLVCVKRVEIDGATLLFTCRDVTDRNQADREQRAKAEALRRSEERYRDIVEDQTELICRFLADGTLTFVNGAYCRYFRRAPGELIGQSFWQLIPAEAHAASQEFLATITAAHPVSRQPGLLEWWLGRVLARRMGILLGCSLVCREHRLGARCVGPWFGHVRLGIRQL